MINISGFGLVAQVTADKTFPSGFSASQFADDADAVASPDLDVADTGMGLNGDLTVWNKANPAEVVVAVIPSSDTDLNFSALLDANRVSKGKASARDVVNAVFVYPSGMTVTCSNGTIISGPIMPGVTQAGRMKTQNYKFRFESIVKTGQ